MQNCASSCDSNAIHKSRAMTLSNHRLAAKFREKTKGQQLKGKIVSHFHTFCTLFQNFSPRASPSKQRVLAQGEQKRRKQNKKNRTKRCCTLVVARLSSSFKNLPHKLSKFWNLSQTQIFPVQNWSLEMLQEPSSKPHPPSTG